jgi:hemolysin activation/secretion protein
MKFKCSRRVVVSCVMIVLGAVAETTIYAADLSAANLTSDASRQLDQQNILNQQHTDALTQAESELSKRNAATTSVTTASTAITPSSVGLTDVPCFVINTIYLKGKLAHRFYHEVVAVFPEDQADKTTDLVSVHLKQPQCMGAKSINLDLKQIQNRIIAAGYITTRVVVGNQNLKQGQLIYTLIPGRLRALKLSPTSASQQPDPSQLWNVYPADPDGLLNLRRLEQALENMKRVPTVDANIQIAPSDKVTDLDSLGDSDAWVSWRQSKPFRLRFTLDDSGTRQIGKYLGGVTLSWDNPLHLNDQFYINYTHDVFDTRRLFEGESGSHGTNGYTGFYSIPLGFYLLTLTSSQNNYHQTVAGNVQNYIYSGDSENRQIKLSNVLYRDATSTTSGSLGGWFEGSHNFIDYTQVDIQRRRTVGWDIGLNQQNHFGTSLLEVNANYRQGTGALNAIPAPEQAIDEGTSRLKVFNADADLKMPFNVGQQYFLYDLTSRVQWSSTPLPYPDRFSIGGRYTVRGFDGSVMLAGDRGQLVRNDLAWVYNPSGQALYIGLDGGHVSGQSTTQLPGKTLVGSALGVRGGYKGWSYDVFMGWPLAKSEDFKASGVTGGLNIGWSY